MELDAYRLVYDKEKVHKLVTVAEQMVSFVHDQHRRHRRHHSECDASSELTSGQESDAEDDAPPTPPLPTPCVVDVDVPAPAVVLRSRVRAKAQRPWSLSAVSGVDARASWTPHSASETALNRLTNPLLHPLSPSAGKSSNFFLFYFFFFFN